MIFIVIKHLNLSLFLMYAIWVKYVSKTGETFTDLKLSKLQRPNLVKKITVKMDLVDIYLA